MKLYRVFALVVVAALLAACGIFGNQTVGSGKLVTENRTVAEFNNLELTCSADVILTQGEPLAVSIEGDDNIVPLIETTVTDRKLTIKTESFTSFRITKPLIVHVVVPALLSIRVTGSGDVKIAKWMGESMDFYSSGSGDISVDDLETVRITVRMSGSGDILFKSGGVVENHTVSISGSGDYKALLESREVDATTSGSGNISIWATEKLSARVSGSGDIQYYGSPTLDKSDTGSGSVERLGDRP